MRKTTSGFTIIELLIVVGIIGILASISLVFYNSIQKDARDSSRSSKITLISEALEKYYNTNGEYPNCATMTQTANTVVSSTLKGMDSNSLTSPSDPSGTNSIICSDPTTDKFGYITNGSNFTLKYKQESDSAIVQKASRKTGGIDAPPAPTISLYEDGTANITAVTCATGTVYYRIKANGNYTEWSTNTNYVITMGYQVNSVQAQAICKVNSTVFSTATSGNIAYCELIYYPE